MILLTRLNGEQFAVNVDLIERAETTPDTVLRMVDGAKLVVAESLDEVIAKVTDFKAAVLRQAADADDGKLTEPAGSPHLRVVPKDEGGGQ